MSLVSLLLHTIPLMTPQASLHTNVAGLVFVTTLDLKEVRSGHPVMYLDQGILHQIITTNMYLEPSAVRTTLSIYITWIATVSSPIAQTVVTCIQHKLGERDKLIRVQHSYHDDRDA